MILQSHASRGGRAIDSMGLPRVPHRHDVFWRNIRLDVMYGGKDKAAPGRQRLDVVLDVLPDLFRGRCAQYVLRIHTAAPEHQVASELALQFDGIHLLEKSDLAVCDKDLVRCSPRLIASLSAHSCFSVLAFCTDPQS